MSSSAARRHWLLRAVANEPTSRIAGSAATFPMLRSLIAERSADLAVIDLQSPVEERLVRDWLIELVDRVTVLLLDSEPDPRIIQHLLRAKTGGLLPADTSPEQIIQAIKSIAAGLMVFDGTLMRGAIPGADDESQVLEPLTPRESEVLLLLADGMGNKEIAARLNVSEHTIKFHIRSILGKLGASSRTEAVSRGLRSGLIEL